MLGGSTQLSAVLGAAPPPDADILRLKSFAKTLASIGMYVLLIEPGGKRPVDMRSSPQKRKEDGAAQDAARAAGRPDWAKAKSKAGVHLATNDPTLLGRYIDRYRKVYADGYGTNVPINFAIAVGPSRLLVVDCDTAGQVTNFLNDFSVNPPIPPAVSSPGQKDAEGNWVHKDGGHYYFTLPDGVDLPQESGSLTMPGGYALLWANRYVLIPPSVRPEGAYTWTGCDYPAVDPILNIVNDHVAQRRSRASVPSEGSEDLATAIDAWAETVSWEDLLEPHGWSVTPRPDQCGCAIFTAPGVHGSTKSATAHDSGCGYGRYTEVNAPLHLWTDNPGEGFEEWIRTTGNKTMSKLQVVAVTEFGGNVGTAAAELGLLPKGDLGMDIDGAVRDMGVSVSNLDQPITMNSLKSTAVDEARQRAHEAAKVAQREAVFANTSNQDEQSTVLNAAEQFAASQDGQAYSYGQTSETSESPFVELEETEESEPPDPFMPNIQPFDYWRDFPAPEFIIDGLVENGGLVSIIGAPGVGKSAVGIDMACSIVAGKSWQCRKVMRQRGLYMPGEGLSGAVQRITAWEKAHDTQVGDDLFVSDAILQAGAPSETWSRLIRYILEHKIGFIMFDTFARMSAGVEENSATEVGKVVARLDQVRKLTGVTIFLIHHTSKGSDSGRGSSALNGALDTEILIKDGTWWQPENGEAFPPGKVLEAAVTKQKNAEQCQPLPLLMVPMHDSIVITGPSGKIGDVFDMITSPIVHLQEPTIETAIRVAEFIADFPEQGATRTEIALGVEPDPYTANRSNTAKRWKLALAKAVDMALRYHLVETLTGTASGTRYIPGTTSPNDMRLNAAMDTMRSDIGNNPIPTNGHASTNGHTTNVPPTHEKVDKS